MSEDQWFGLTILSVIFGVGVGILTNNVGGGLVAFPMFIMIVAGFVTIIKR